MAYLFTDTKGKAIEIINDPEWMGDQAAKYRRMLERKHGIEVVSWAKMGGTPDLEVDLNE